MRENMKSAKLKNMFYRLYKRKFSVLKSGQFARIVAAGLVLAAAIFVSFASAQTNRPNDPLFTAAENVEIKMITSSMLMAVAKAGNRLVAVGERGHIIVSDDHGENWRQVPCPVSVTLTSICFPSPEKGWVTGFEGVILGTCDRGETWTRQTDRTSLNREIVQWLIKKQQAKAEKGKEAAFAISPEDLQYSLDDWKKYLDGQSCPPFMDIWFKDDRQGIAVGAFGLAVGTFDGGKTWNPMLQINANPMNYHYYKLACHKDRLFLAGESGLLLGSGDWGKSWQPLSVPYDGSFFGVCAGENLNTIVAYGLRGTIIVSADGGRTWRQVPQSLTGSLCGSCLASDGNFWLTGPLGQIVKVDGQNAGVTALAENISGAVDLVESNPGQFTIVGINGLKQIVY